MGDARIDAIADRMMDEHVAKNRDAAVQIARWALDSFDAVSASECDALRDELGIAQERGDGWRSIVKEDTIELERLRGAASECEKLRAALAALVEADEKFFGNEPEGDYDALNAARALVGPTPPGISDRDRKLGQAIAMLRFGSEEEFNESFAAARALVGSVPPNEATKET